MAFYFFADINGMNTQTDNAFGPASNINIGGIDYEQYLVTSMHTAANSAKAISVCRGQIFIQEQTENSDLLNIVFKPLDTQSFNFPKIQYFIYKGIRKDSLIADNDTDIIGTGNNDLADSIWAAFTITNTDGAPSKSILGLDQQITSLLDTVNIEKVFTTLFSGIQMWTVAGGSSLGLFDQDSIGFEIITYSVYYSPTLQLVRNSGTYIQSAALDDGGSQADFFNHWRNKEDILNFIDPCAFFGCFYDNTLSVINNGQTTSFSGDDIYTQVLQNFLNKNMCYIDIRNEFNLSLNFFKNYGNSPTDNTTNISMQKGDSVDTVEIDYYTSTWPILTLTTTDFPATNDNYQPLTIQLPAGNGDNPSPLIFFSRAFVGTDDFPNEYDKWEMFQSLNVTDNLTDEFTIGLPWSSDSLISSYAQLKYSKQYSDATLPAISSVQIRKADYLDGLFCTSMNFDPSSSSYKTKIFDENLYIDNTSIEYFDGVFGISISFDSENVTLTAYPNIFNTSDSQRTTMSPSSEHQSLDNTMNYIEDLALNQDGSDFLNMILVSGGEDLAVLQTKSTFTDYAEQLNTPDYRKLLGFTITVAEWNSLIQSSLNNNFLQNYPIYIIVTNKQVLMDDNGLDYTSLQLSLTGFISTGDNVSVQQISTDVNLLTYGTF